MDISSKLGGMEIPPNLGPSGRGELLGRGGGCYLSRGRWSLATIVPGISSSISSDSSSRTRRRGGIVARSRGASRWWVNWGQAPPPSTKHSDPPQSVSPLLASATGGGSITTPAPTLSDVLWPSAGAFLAMALLARMDHIVASKGVSFTIAPLGAVCAVLLAAPTSPAAKKENMFLAQITCAAFGVIALLVFGPGWLARSTAVAASIAFMILTRATHPPAASLPILFIDGAKLHHLGFWYVVFPGAVGCILLCIIQEMVLYLKANCRF